jgi:hypothetical protein
MSWFLGEKWKCPYFEKKYYGNPKLDAQIADVYACHEMNAMVSCHISNTQFHEKHAGIRQMVCYIITY